MEFEIFSKKFEITAKQIEIELTKEQIDYLVENGCMPDENKDNLESMSLTSLKEMAKEKGIKNYSKMNKAEIIDELDKVNKEK